MWQDQQKRKYLHTSQFWPVTYVVQLTVWDVFSDLFHVSPICHITEYASPLDWIFHFPMAKIALANWPSGVANLPLKFVQIQTHMEVKKFNHQIWYWSPLWVQNLWLFSVKRFQMYFVQECNIILHSQPFQTKDKCYNLIDSQSSRSNNMAEGFATSSVGCFLGFSVFTLLGATVFAFLLWKGKRYHCYATGGLPRILHYQWQ